MRLTSFTDYGLRRLMRIASAPEHAYSTTELAEEFERSRNHLSKILQRLSRSGIVDMRRGGGAMLARLPQAIRLGDVVRLLKEDQPLVECLRTEINTCTLDGQCRLKARLRATETTFLRDLDQATPADVALPAAFAGP